MLITTPKTWTTLLLYSRTDALSIRNHRLLVGLIIASVLAVGVPLIMLLVFASEEWARLVAFLAGPAALLGVLVLGLTLYFEKKKEQAEFGEDLGIRLRKADLKKQGADGFWTQKEWELQVKAAAQRG